MSNGKPMKPTLPKMNAAWNMCPRSTCSRMTLAISQVDEMSSTYITAWNTRMMPDSSRSARVAPAVALENTISGMPTLRISWQMPSSVFSP